MTESVISVISVLVAINIAVFGYIKYRDWKERRQR